MNLQQPQILPRPLSRLSRDRPGFLWLPAIRGPTFFSARVLSPDVVPCFCMFIHLTARHHHTGPAPFAVSDPHLSQTSPSSRGGAHPCPHTPRKEGLSEIGGVTDKHHTTRRVSTLYFRGGVKKPVASSGSKSHFTVGRKSNVSLFGDS